MKKRLNSLEKTYLLQSKLRDQSVWRLAAIGRQRDELEEIQREMVVAIDRDALARGPLLAASTRRLRAIDVLLMTAKADFEVQSQRVLDQGVRAKLAERLLERVEAEHRTQTERRELGDLIERTLRDDTFSPAQGL